MEFSPFNPQVKLCLSGMEMEEKGKPEEALGLFMQAWNQATNNFEKFLAAHYVARQQKTNQDRLKWLETALEFALQITEENSTSIFPSLYSNIAACYKELNQAELAKKHEKLASEYKNKIADAGPFYHGTRADLQIGDLLVAGAQSNYKSEYIMNHIYFTALLNGAGLAAALAKGEGRERVYIVEPTGSFEHDPNLTDKKFPGNPTRSYRSEFPLKIVGEMMEWARQAPEDLEKFRAKLDTNKGEIIN